MRQIWVGCILLSTAVGGLAATLGRHSGAAVIGRPLDMRVQALLGPDEDLSALCVQSEVFYGDAQVSPGSVRVTPQKSAPDAEASLRIQVSIPVDEPVVTVYLRAGCNAPFSRRYVLLADPVTEPQSAQAGALPQGAQASAPVPSVVAPRVLPPVSGVTEPLGRSSGAAPSSASAGQAVGQPSVRTRPSAETKTDKARPGTGAASVTKPSVVRKPPVAAAAPRLELEPVDVSLDLDRDPVLKLSLSMLSEPTASEQERAAAARLWKAINASPEEILRDNQKLEALEAEAKGLREQALQNKSALEAMESQLEQSRHLSWLVYALGASLLAALLAVAYLWRKRSSALGSDDDGAARAWWAAAAAEKEMESGIAMPNGKAGTRALDLDLDLDLDLGTGRNSSLDRLRSLHEDAFDEDSGPVALHAADKREFSGSHPGVSRSVATEELFDVQQQADFFVSLGENDQAIRVLKEHLAESHEPSALAYLDLFKLYHKLGRRDDYNQLREDFNRLFNAGAPPFDQYSDVSRGLEDYETALGRIQALWPQPKVLDVIEKSIFREPGDMESEVFDLEAYRELLLLHALAKDMIKRDGGGSKPMEDFQHTAIKPLKAVGKKPNSQDSAEAEAFSGRPTQPMDEIPHASPRLGLDVDLDALDEISAFEASLPEVPALVEPTAKPVPGRAASQDLDMGNLIDFEMLDFMPPEGDTPIGPKTGKKH